MPNIDVTQNGIQRRVFLGEALLVMAGITLTPLIYLASCKGAVTVTSETLTENPPVKTTPTDTISTSTTPTVTTSPSTKPTETTSASTTTSSTSIIGDAPYVPPTTGTVLVPTPGCPSKVATDRLYSKDHTWIKSFGSDKVVIGITDMLQLMLVPTNVILPEVGQRYTQGDTIGALEGQKLLLDLICPVSGVISQVNPYLRAQANPEGIHIIVDDTWGAGWMVVIMLSKPDELKGLLTWQQYMEYSSKIEAI